MLRYRRGVGSISRMVRNAGVKIEDKCSEPVAVEYGLLR